MRPFTASTETKVLEELTVKLQGRKAELAKWEDEQHPPLSIGQAWSEFLASPNRPDSGESTLRQYEFQWQAFADWMKEKHPDILALRGVSKEIAEEYASGLNHGKFSPSTYNKHLNLLALVFRVLNDKAKLTFNPWKSPKQGGCLQRKRLISSSRRELTIDELRKVCEAATGELKTMLAIGLYTGLRLGDAATLRWCEVDLKRRLIQRIPNKVARRCPRPVSIPVHPVLANLLANIPANERGDYVLPEMNALYNRRTDMVTDLVQNHFKACGIKCHKPDTGMDGKRAVVEIGFHSLRHSFVSMCRAANAPLSVVQSIVGHSSPLLTGHYTHTGIEAAQSAVALLADVTGDATPEPPKRGPVEILRDVQTIVKSMTAANWKTKKAVLLALVTTNGQLAISNQSIV